MGHIQQKKINYYTLGCLAQFCITMYRYLKKKFVSLNTQWNLQVYINEIYKLKAKVAQYKTFNRTIDTNYILTT